MLAGGTGVKLLSVRSEPWAKTLRMQRLSGKYDFEIRLVQEVQSLTVPAALRSHRRVLVPDAGPVIGW
jgi:hypothetical protein